MARRMLGVDFRTCTTDAARSSGTTVAKASLDTGVCVSITVEFKSVTIAER